MTQVRKPPQHPLPHSIRAKLDEVRELLRGYLFWRWFWMLVGWVLLVYWLGAAMDYLPVLAGSNETPRAIRIGLLAVMAIGAVWMVLGWLMPRLLTPIRDASIALLIERRSPQLKNELITAVELAETPAEVTNPEVHAELLGRVLAAADQSIGTVVARELFYWKPLRWLGFVVSLGIVLSVGACIAQWEWVSLWSKRLFALSDQPWPRSARLRVDDLLLPLPAFSGQLNAEQARIGFDQGLARIPMGASPLLQISADASTRRVPEVCTLYYRSDDGAQGRANLRRIGAPQNGWQQFNLDGPPLSGVSNNLTLDIVGLDARLRNLKVEVVDRVVITDLQLVCSYPSYLLDTLSSRPSHETIEYRTGLKIPEGTVCTIVGTCNSPLSRVQYLRQDSLDGDDASSDGAVKLEIQDAKIDAAQFHISLGMLRSSQRLEIRLLDQYGLSSDQIVRYSIVVLPDAIPEVESSLHGIGLAITPQAYLPIRGKVVDDYEVAEVAADISADETIARPVALQLQDTQLLGEIDFQQLSQKGELSIRPGMTVGISVRATDRYDLDENLHIGRGQAQQLAVVTEDQLLVILDRQELELRQRLEQIISELSQLQEALRGLIEQLNGLGWRMRLGGQHRLTSSNDASNSSVEITAVFNASQASSTDVQDRQTVQRMAVLKAQQGLLQADKSRQELAGIMNRVENLRLQLLQNRIDSLDRQQRLLDKVQVPLADLLTGEYSELDRRMNRLQSATQAGNGLQQAGSALDSLEKILVALEAIKSSMLDIESYNEIIDLVRQLLEEQERLLKETEDTQKARVLELFK